VSTWFETEGSWVWVWELGEVGVVGLKSSTDEGT